MSAASRLLNEKPLWLQAVPAFLPPLANGRRVSHDTLDRWRLRGVELPDGTVAKLEWVRVGGRVLTSHEALARFIDAQTPADEPATGAAVRSPARRNAASERAAKELEAMGC